MASVLNSVIAKAEAATAALPSRVQNVLNLAQYKTGVPRAYFLLGLGAFSALYMIFGYFAEFLSNLVGLVYPAYASTRAIESADRNDDTRWLTYWVVYACFSIVDFFAEGILNFFPLYWLAKVLFLVYCFAPVPRNGSARIYDGLVRPYFLKSSVALEDGYAKVSAKVYENVSNAFLNKQQ